MLHKETVETATLDLIKHLMSDPVFLPFRLVGGTALALMIGHRISVDIDFFSEATFDAKKVALHVRKNYRTDKPETAANSFSCFINDIKFDCLSHRYPWVGEPVTVEGIRMCSIQDIAAMKVNAIVGNGTRFKDFADIFFILEHLSIQQVIKSFTNKYPGTSEEMAILSLTYFDDVIVPKNLYILDPVVNWNRIRGRIREAAQKPTKIFDRTS